MSELSTDPWPLTPHMRERLIKALSGTPLVASRLTAALTASDPRWDRRPDPTRYSLREVVAHLADWDRIYVDRLIAMQERPGSHLEDFDENRLALAHDYTHADPFTSLRRFAESRRRFVNILRELDEAQWARSAVHPRHGTITVSLHASYVLMHDGYHTEQIADWMRLPE